MIRRGLFMLTEASWLLAPLILLDAALPGAVPPLAVVFLLYPLAWAAAVLVPIRDDRLWVEIAVSAGLGIGALGILAAVSWAAGTAGEHPVARFVIAAPIGALAWIRGWLLARREPLSRTFALSFQFGLVVLAVALFFASDLGVPVSTQIALALGLVVFGLGGLWLARVEAADRHGGARNPGTALLGLGAVLALGALLWVLLDRSALEAGLAALDWLGRQIGGFFAYLVGLLPPSPESGDAVPEPYRPDPPPTLPERPDTAFEPPAFVVTAFAVIFGGVVLVAIGVVLYHFFKALAQRKRPVRTRGIVYGRARGGLLEELMALLRRGARRIRRAAAAFLQHWRESRREGSVRGRYARLLARLARRGWPRRTDQTPDEYRRRLAPEWPEGAPHLESMTRAFVAARYGGREPDGAMIEDLWRRLESAIGKLRRPHD